MRTTTSIDATSYEDRYLFYKNIPLRIDMCYNIYRRDDV